MARLVLLLVGILTLSCASAQPSTPDATHVVRERAASLQAQALAGETEAQREQRETLMWAANFREAQKRYTESVRWGLVDDAAAFVAPELRSDFRALASRELREVRLTDYAIDELHLEPKADQARADVRYQGYWLASPFVQWVSVSQDWQHSADERRWYVRPDIDHMRKQARAAAP